MPDFSFIHCSDLHLGCQQFNDPVRWQDFGDAFSFIIDFAIEKEVDFVLAAGDLFHHRSINARTLGLATVLLDRLKRAGIRLYAIEGNHDKAFYLDEESWMSYLDRMGYITLLKPVFREGRLELGLRKDGEGCTIEEERCRIIGLGYLGATTRQRLEEVSAQLGESDKFTVVMLHAAVDKLMGQDLAGVGREAFSSFEGKVDYFALGHIHGRQEYAGFIYNPGAPECVHIDEVRKNREKGFYHITVHDRDKEVVFHQSRRRAVFYCDVDLTGIKLPEEACSRVLKAMEMQPGGTDERPMVQIVLQGQVNFSAYTIDAGYIAEVVKERFDCLAVEVINNANLSQATREPADGTFDREAIERSVINGMLQEEKPELAHMQDELADMIISLKNNLLAGTPDREIIAAVEGMLDGYVLSEAAPVGEEKTDDGGILP